jgi:ornithine cyclodeaminase/alanine dehydrogenase-like protein (mu-crystallin family)
MQIRVIDGSTVRRLLSMEDCLSTTRQAMILAGNGQATQPIRSAMYVPGQANLLGMMPGFVDDPRRLGIKVTTVYPSNFGTGLGSHQGMICLFDPSSGSPVGLVEGGSVTALRTGAASAVATDVLARSDATSVGIYGYGEQAASHLEAIALTRRLDYALVWGRSKEKAEAFAREQSRLRDLEVRVAGSCEAVASSCDILCTVTAAREPFLEGRWLRAGVHLNVVGSSIPTTSEIDVEAVVRSRFFSDFTPSALALAGDFKRARDEGAVDESHLIGCIGDVLSGRALGRVSRDDITLFKSLGMISEDLVAADFVLRRAAELGAGVLVDL